ncbi:hypothetical protein [Marinoscillum sp. MHG1-6]|uniref:hypothetical protein n=1 Tax=Marinoscillum sp. MHG1-6 TaxID=2959627 RepID=UPI0035BE17BE
MNDGEVAMTELVFPNSPFSQLVISNMDVIQNIEIMNIKSIWGGEKPYTPQ